MRFEQWSLHFYHYINYEISAVYILLLLDLFCKDTESPLNDDNLFFNAIVINPLLGMYDNTFAGSRHGCKNEILEPKDSRQLC